MSIRARIDRLEGTRRQGRRIPSLIVFGRDGVLSPGESAKLEAARAADRDVTIINVCEVKNAEIEM